MLLPISHTQPSEIDLPGSKSISNRVLLLAALSKNACYIKRLLKSDDTERMLDALSALGVSMQKMADDELIIHGTNGVFRQPETLFLGNAGTAFRPLTAVLAVLGVECELTGVARMYERPIADLVVALRQIGADIQYLGNDGFPPLKIGKFVDNGCRTVQVSGSVSSQFLSALLMALPLTKKAYEIQVVGDLISKPYIDITLNLLKRFGVEIDNQNYQVFRLPENTCYTAPNELLVEGDASGASYFMAAGLLGKNPIKINGIDANSIQGDIAFARHLQQMGANIEWGDGFISVSAPNNLQIQAFDIDANAIPDAAMTFAVIALAANGKSVIRNIASWRVKETDRIAAMACELRKLGAEVKTTNDAIFITPPEKLNENVAIDTYDDHRMAMCFSLVSLLGVPVVINNPECVNKTFPKYFEVFQGIMG
ncbi:MAG: 3-phosphoshikimate 1-carboxyvinyltransferase [Neisseriaceae bacterium]|nr:3-phosphoshikimate 1-carboxyvinyltransferase [Neisseriaceae bacterium]